MNTPAPCPRPAGLVSGSLAPVRDQRPRPPPAMARRPLPPARRRVVGLMRLAVGLVILGLAVIVAPAGRAANLPSGTPFRPAVLFQANLQPETRSGGFIEMAAAGARAFGSLASTTVAEIFPDRLSQDAGDPTLATTRHALSEGYTVLVGVGFNFADAFAALAPAYPDHRFILIDGVVNAPNVQSIVFREEEGSYLVGVLAALASRTGRIGFVGGWDIPLIRKFACGYVQGARSVRPDIAISAVMAGTTLEAFYRPEDGYRLTLDLIDQGVDVIYHAAGRTGAGVLRAVAERGVLGIGVDTNQNGEAPGHILTSMLKRVDIAVFSSLTALWQGKWTPGLTTLGLTEGGVGWALDADNVQLLDDRMFLAVEDAEFDIRTGHTAVAVYTPLDGCPGFSFARTEAGIGTFPKSAADADPMSPSIYGTGP